MSPWLAMDETQLESRGVVTLTLQRVEKRNALTRQLLLDLLAAVERLESLAGLRVAVLRAEGAVFCAGMDLGEMQAHAQSPDGEREWQADSQLYCEVLTRWFRLRVPTVAQVQGPVLAGGVGLVLASDMVVSTRAAFLALPEPVRGITAAIVTPFLVYRVGAGIAGQWLLAGQRIGAEAAARAGLGTACCDPEGLEAAVEALLQSILTGSPQALAMTKTHWHACSNAAAVVEQAEHSIRVSAEARSTADAREGLAAFLEKRPPRWSPAS
jgi:methylglutaconyl-CoA hydratase